jgi:hypothetical protein
MKKLIILLPMLVMIGCAKPGSVNVSTQTPADTDLKIVIESTSKE